MSGLGSQQTETSRARAETPAAAEDQEPVLRSWGTPNAALALLLLALVAVATVVVLRAPATGSGDAEATVVSARQRAVVAAARDEAAAFLTVDHRSTPVLAQRVLAGATGGFARSFRAGLADLTASVARSQATARPTLRAVGVRELSASEATVFVAADAQVSNRRTGGTEQARYYRLELHLVRQDGRWLTSDLSFVD
ncbi:MAG: hypothetical protein JWR20_265 [Marmoricola sp.]|nr:hypothetical protein [Marmoricola sp.]